jgi:hypothetical protein
MAHHKHRGALAGGRALPWVSAWMAAAVAALAPGCSQAPLERFQAAQLIQNSQDFRRHQTVSLEHIIGGGCDAALASSPRWRQFRDVGLIELRPIQRWSRQTRDPACEARLSEEARRTLNSMAADRVRAFEETVDGSCELPTADRTYVRIERMTSSDPDLVDIDFLWQWSPNLLGSRLGLDTKLRAGQARFWRYSEGWRLVRLTLAE